MPRIARFLKEDEPTVYHVISRTALEGLPFKDEDKEYMLELIKKWSKIFFVVVLLPMGGRTRPEGRGIINLLY
ncbi:MAG: hypothetical protein LWW94_11405 [Candidatus Desulfofervidaceae bacterium]|nr:hypothetical protein [Candidatus Desulfofervidaceae bacterium]